MRCCGCCCCCCLLLLLLLLHTTGRCLAENADHTLRVSTRAAELLPHLNIDPGLAMDLTTTDELGRPWDFSKEEMKSKARAKLRKQKPDLLVGSPMCTLYSAWQRLNKNKDIRAYRKRLKDARAHMEFVCELYLEQIRAGRLFLHEHPEGASSWDEEGA